MELWGESLLELCANKLQCYISDLAWPIIRTNTEMKEALFHLLTDMCVQQCDVHEWNEGISYILGENKTFTQVSEAREYLISQLEKIKGL